MTRHHYRHAITNADVYLELPEGQEPPAKFKVPSPNNELVDYYYHYVPLPEPKPQWTIRVTWDNGQSTEFHVDEADVLYQVGELVRDRICKTFRLIKPSN